MTSTAIRDGMRMVSGGLALLLVFVGVCRADPFFTQTNLVSSVPGLAPVTDTNLRNPWGIAHSATSPFWIANQVTGTATIYNGAGTPVPLVVTIPNPTGGQGSPTIQRVPKACLLSGASDIGEADLQLFTFTCDQDRDRVAIGDPNNAAGEGLR